MPGWARLGDINSAPAPIVGGVAFSVIINDKPAAIVGSICSPHPPAHPSTPIVVGEFSVICENKSAAPTGAVYACGHTQVQSSFDVIIGV